MQEYLSQKFPKDDPDFLRKSMQARVDAQYYSNRKVEAKFHKDLLKKAPIFLIKCKEIINSLKEEEINEIRKKLELVKQEIDKENKNKDL